jgi:hypothetical protein
MNEVAFYEAGCQEVQGKRRIIVPVRRALRRVLRPIFLKLDERLDLLDRRQDQLDRDLKAIEAMACDQLALSRRLAMLEDHLESLLAHGIGRDANRSPEGDERSLIRYPRLEENSGDHATPRVNEAQAKVS